MRRARRAGSTGLASPRSGSDQLYRHAHRGHSRDQGSWCGQRAHRGEFGQCCVWPCWFSTRGHSIVASEPATTSSAYHTKAELNSSSPRSAAENGTLGPLPRGASWGRASSPGRLKTIRRASRQSVRTRCPTPHCTRWRSSPPQSSVSSSTSSKCRLLTA